MIFLELVLQNFGPYLGRQTINLRPICGTSPEGKTHPTTRPIILLGGMNGGGKTTLMDAIRLALYGTRAQCSTRGNLSYSDFLNQCVNRHTPPTEETRIELAFEVIQDDRPTTLRIRRSWTKDPKDGKDTLRILLDGDWSDKALAQTWDDYIENLLPLGISNLFLFDGEQVKELAELETPPPIVVGAIQSLLGLELVERLSTDLDILASRKRKDIANVKQLATLEDIEQTLKRQKEEFEIANQELAALEAKLKRAEDKQRRASDKFIYDGGKIARDRSQLEAQKKQLLTQAEQTRQNLRELAALSLPLALIAPLLEKAKTQAEQETHLTEAKIAYSILQAREKRLLAYMENLSLAASKLTKIKTFLSQENRQFEQEIDGKGNSWLHADTEAIAHLDSLLTYEIKTHQVQAQARRGDLQTLETEIDFLDRQLATAAPPEAYQKLEKAVRDAQDQVAKLKAACETAKQRCNQIEREIKQTKNELEDYTDESLKLRNDRHIINSVSKVKATLKLFKEKLTLKKLNKLEIEVTECFRYLLQKTDLVHRVAIDTNTFSLSLYDPQGQPVPKHRLSAGEKQLLAIAFLWGLARVSGRHLPVAIDTPLARLDSSHRTNLIDRYFPAASHQVILLSTDTEIGKTEVERLRELDAIAREYLLQYDPANRQTSAELGYFW